MNIQRIELPNLQNTRDIGGLVTVDGLKIKKQKLIRSGKLNDGNHEDYAILVSQYGLNQIVDFRNSDEKQENPDPFIIGVDYLSLPLFEESLSGITHDQKAQTSWEEMKKDPINQMILMYERIISSSFSQKQYHQFIQFIIDHSDSTILWHCTAGKDRAGLGAYFIEKILGVSTELCRQDYLMTNEFRTKRIKQVCDEYRNRTGLDNYSSFLPLYQARDEYLDKAIETMTLIAGSVDNYIRDKLKVDEKMIHQLRSIYLEK